MSTNHNGGNIVPEITREEHDGELNAKRVSLVSTATIHAVVNTSAGGNVTVEQGSDPWNVAVKGNLTLSDPKGFIGLTTVVQASSSRSIIGNVTLSDPRTYIGLVTAIAVQGGNWDVAIVRGNVTVEQGDNPWVTSISGNVTLSDPKGFIGLATVVQASSVRSLVGNLTLSDSKGFIGLTTAVNGQAWPDPKGFIGLVTVVGSLSPAAGNVTLDAGSKTQIVGNLTLSDPKGFIGLVTVVGSLSPAAGNVTLDAGSLTGIVGNLSISSLIPGTGATNLGKANSAVVGATDTGVAAMVLITDSPATGTTEGDYGHIKTDTNGHLWTKVANSVTVITSDPISAEVVGNVAHDGFDSGKPVKVGGYAKATAPTDVSADGDRVNAWFLRNGAQAVFNTYGSAVTVYTGVISATGNTTVAVPPSGERFFLKNLHISSLGRSELEIRSGPTTLIPFTSLSTTAGFFEHYGELGLPARANDHALVINLNGAATISYMANVRYAAA